MNFYHSFPRIPRLKRSTFDEYAIGLAILESIIKNGLLLTPEPLEIPQNYRSVRASPPNTTINQYRACFTLLERDDLLKKGGHANNFGSFAIGIDTLEARRLGILPTFYYYKNAALPSEEEDSGLSQEILFRLAEIRRILAVLATVEAKSSIDNERAKSVDYLNEVGLTLEDEGAVAKRLRALKVVEADHIVDLFETDRVAAWNLAEWVELILSVFQTADSAKRNRHLAYLSQREWRIIQLYTQNLICIPLDKSISCRLEPHLRNIAARTYQDIVEIRKRYGLGFLPDCTFLLVGTTRRRVRAFIEEIVVPACCKNEVLALLMKYQLSFVFEPISESKHVAFVRKQGHRISAMPGDRDA